MNELVDIQLQLTKELHSRIAELGAQCGLTAEQMASAIFVLSQQSVKAPEELK